MSFATIAGLFGGGTILLYIALALFAPGLLNVLQPIVTAVINGITTFVSYVWGGFLYVSKSVPAMVFILVLIATTHFYSRHTEKGAIVADLHKHYKFVPKKQANDPTTIFTNPLAWWRGR